MENEKGLRIRSFENGEETAATWRAEAHHQAFPGMPFGRHHRNSFRLSFKLDSSKFLMKKQGKTAPDCTVTANYAVKLLRPTPFDATIYLKARVVESTDTTATVEAELIAERKSLRDLSRLIRRR